MLMLDSNLKQQKLKSRFIFYCRWSGIGGYAETVQKSWNLEVDGSRMFKFHKKTQELHTGIARMEEKGRYKF